MPLPERRPVDEKSHAQSPVATHLRSAAEEDEAFTPPDAPQNTVLAILFALSFSHLLNDTMQSLLPAIYPLLKTSFDLSFTQIGLITLINQLTASLLQPLVGLYTDRYS